MKYGTVFILIALLCAVCVMHMPFAHAQTHGQLRLMEQRATKVVHMKNEFVTRVLDVSGISYQLMNEGIVYRLLIEDKWVDVNRIEIIPLSRQSEDSLQVTGHELFFYTGDKIYRLVSDLVAR